MLLLYSIYISDIGKANEEFLPYEYAPYMVQWIDSHLNEILIMREL